MTHTLDRPNLNLKMQQRILKTATSLFLRKGFAGVSLGDVAKKLEIHPSHIYHYFASKEELWSAVKRPFLEKYWQEFEEVIPPMDLGLRSFLETYLAASFDYWYHHATTARILRWCNLEEKQVEMKAPDPLRLVIEQFQSQGMIAGSIPASVAAAMMRSAAKGPFFCSSHVSLRESSAREAYLRMIVECMERLFTP